MTHAALRQSIYRRTGLSGGLSRLVLMIKATQRLKARLHERKPSKGLVVTLMPRIGGRAVTCRA